MAHHFRCTVLASAIGLIASSLAADPPPQSFEGTWEAYPSCPAGAPKNSDRCSYFAIALYERGGKLCGVHSFATPGGARMDDGDAPSIIGSMSGPIAEIQVTSGRADPAVTIHAQITRSGSRLHWQSLEAKDGDYLIAHDVWMTRTSRPMFSDALNARVKAACGG
jgi:hypothetical protein